MPNYADDKRLPKSVDIRSSNRPVKVAFIVPSEECEISHWVLDGIFHDAYCRWGGAHSLIIPIQDDGNIHDDYLSWLKFFDPDFVYSYVDLEPHVIFEINQYSMPIEMIRHEIRGEADRWSNMVPSWLYGFEPVKSISTLTSPCANYSGWSQRPTPQLFITQYYDNAEIRFLPDNFGVSHHRTNVTYGQKGTFETICYCPEDLPETSYVGDYRSSDLLELIDKLTKNEVRTFSRLASIHSEGISHPYTQHWDDTFNLFVGDTVCDRLNFWNCRNLSRSSSNDLTALIISQDSLKDENFCRQIGEFLNRHNFVGRGSGPSVTTIRSASLGKVELEKITEKLKKLTWTLVSVTNSFSSNAAPDAKASHSNQYKFGTTCPSIKVNDFSNTIVAHEPEHFQYLPTTFLHAKEGQWLVEMQIERHQDDCQYLGAYNDWKLPRRQEVASAFTRNLAKISESHNLTLIPTSLKTPFGPNISLGNTINLNLPNDETIFNYLITHDTSLLPKDMRKNLINKSKYKQISISDKGENHRGVVALFNNNIQEASILTNSFWRDILRSKPKKSYALKAFESKINELKQDELADVIDQMRFKNVNDAKKYLKKNLQDTIEYLVHLGVMQQTHSWRCQYCGNKNFRSLDTIKVKSACDICSKEYCLPIDMEWKYSFLPYVKETLSERNGLTVLWAISTLLDNSQLKQSVYMPEVNLHKNYDDNESNEIDFVGLIDGNFVVAEAKLSAASFIEDKEEQAKFIDEVKRIQPDIAYLIFEQYCNGRGENDTSEATVETANNEDEYRLRLSELMKELEGQIPKTTTLKKIVAQDIPEFNGAPIEIGPHRKRTHKILDDLDDIG